MHDPTSSNSLFDIAASFVLQTNRHIFLTGRAGTGKTTFLKHIKQQTSKNAVIVAPTGVAAINAGGVTIHSFFQLPMGSFIPVRQRGFSISPSAGTDLPTLLKNIRFNKEKRRLLEELELLIIDEVSMLRADMLDAVDGILRHFRKKIDIPFGGVQVVYIGDLFQLPPVVSNDEWQMLSAYYKSIFFFDAHVVQSARPINIELDKIYRQSDLKFITLLNNIRNNEATEDDLSLLNKYYDPSFYPDPDEGYIILTSHNYKADKINQGALAKLNNEAYSFEGALAGDFNENALPVDKVLTIKAGAQIMFIKNDKGDQRRYYNGKIGMVSRIKDSEIWVRFPGEREELQLEQETWRNIRYNYNESADKIEEEELGSYKQYPIRLAWAVTIHKSQGLTFERAIVDAGQSFAPGQVYVALSRLISLSGLVLASPITLAAIHSEPRIADFSRIKNDVGELQLLLQQAQKEYLLHVFAKVYNLDKILEAFREHHAGYADVKIPDQGKAVAWSDETLRAVTKLKDVSDKFCRQLAGFVANGQYDRYASLQERVVAASTYYIDELDRIMANLRTHMSEFRVKAKVKKYIRTLDLLQELLLKKTNEIRQSTVLADGLRNGQNITQLLESFQLQVKQPTPNGKAEATGAVKDDSKTISLQLLQKGKSIDEIAAERGLARSTVEGHLIQFIATGEVKMEAFVPREKELVIRNAINKAPEKTINIVREITGNACTYNEIRAVLLQMDRESVS